MPRTMVVLMKIRLTAVSPLLLLRCKQVSTTHATYDEILIIVPLSILNGLSSLAGGDAEGNLLAARATFDC